MISDLHLQQYRSYHDATFEFGKGVNIIVGPNASGKTNLIEALLVLARGSSYRVVDGDLVGFDSPWFRLAATNEVGDERIVKYTAEPREKTLVIADKSYKRWPQDKLLPVVLFEPNHLQLLHGSPELRRTYLDDILEQTIPSYSATRRHYKRTLTQRNTLLKRAKKPVQQELFPWNLRLSELGAVMARARHELVQEFNTEIQKLYTEISETNTAVSLAYTPRFPVDSYETTMLHTLEERLSDDILRGYTTSGPHREDMVVLFGENHASQVASRGETRTLILALKVLELEKIESRNVLQPILLLDDVFSELDGVRRRALTTHLQKYQTFLTTTDADIATRHFTDSTIIPLTKNT